MIRKAQSSDVGLAVAQARALWPEDTEQALGQLMETLLASPEAAVFLAFDGELCEGFAQCQLRHDYVEGTKTSPVGYLEGIYVAPQARRTGTAKALLAACERWAAAQGCTQFASDCEADNAQSAAFHRKMGFAEAGRIVCFVKEIGGKTE